LTGGKHGEVALPLSPGPTCACSFCSRFGLSVLIVISVLPPAVALLCHCVFTAVHQAAQRLYVNWLVSWVVEFAFFLCNHAHAFGPPPAFRTVAKVQIYVTFTALLLWLMAHSYA
jgi:hypothetical protein